MSIEAVFGLGNQLALIGWASLVLLPRWRGVSEWLAGLVIPALLALGYLVLIAMHWSAAPGGFGSLADVMALFTAPPIALAGWWHYLAFDLFVGNWALRRSQEAAIPHPIMIPVLLATFLFGPIGLLLFLLVRAAFAVGRSDGAWLARLPAVPAGWRGLRLDPVLTAGALVCLALMAPTLVALTLDPRLVHGAAAWLKPLKFEASLTLYLLTLALLLPLTSPTFRTSLAGRFVVWGATIPSLLEIGYIAWRASQGEASHYNVGTPLAAALYQAMAAGAVTLTAAAPVLAWGLMRRDAAPLAPALRWSLRIGLMLTFVLGVINGFAMGGNPGRYVGIVPTPHATVPLLGWSLEIGDLRVAHFLGLHAMHVIPLFGLLAAAAMPRRALVGVVAFSAAYVALTALTFWAALAGRPLLGLG